MRLDKFLADSNLGTRNHVKTLIRGKHVTVNGEVVRISDTNINLENDKIEVDGSPIKYVEEIFLLLNKPKGYLCSSIDELYPSILNIINPIYAKRVKIVGRLDVDTTGVLLLTDQGKLNNRLIHPKFQVEKEYEAVLNNDVPDEILPLLIQEIEIGAGEIVKPKKVEKIKSNSCRIIVSDGKYHEIKRIFKHFGLEVIELRRIRLGFLTVDDLQIGESRLLNENEINQLKDITKIEK